MSWVDITTAVGTAGAALVALGLGLRAEVRASQTERQTRIENEQHQAIHVAAWMLVEQDTGEGPREIYADDPSFDERKAHVYKIIQNASEEPIWNVFVTVADALDENPESLGGILFIGPREVYKAEIGTKVITNNRWPLKIEFQDNAERDWTRDSRGKLHHGSTGRKIDDALLQALRFKRYQIVEGKFSSPDA